MNTEQPAAATDLDMSVERSLIGAMLVDRAALVEVQNLLVADDLHSADHRHTFAAMLDLAKEARPVDPLTVADNLRSAGQRVLCGRPLQTYLVEIAAEAPVSAIQNARHYAEIIARRSALRALRLVASRVADVAEEDNEQAGKLVLEAQRLVSQIAKGRTRPGVDMADLVQPMLDEFEGRAAARSSGGGKLVGISTGLTALDQQTGGYRKGTLNVIGARTSLGKTSYACQVALIGAVEEKIPALIFSLEMTPRELGERFFARLAKVDSQRLRSGDLDLTDFKALQQAGSLMYQRGLVTISNTRTLAGIATEARAFRVMHPNTDIAVIVDYLQIVRTGERGRTREQEVAEISASLKGLAVECECPFIVPAQLNRSSEAEERDPRVTDIRESGAIENDADFIGLIHRKRNDRTGACWVLIAKNRNGPVGGEVEAHWDGATYTLRDPDHNQGGEQRWPSRD